MAPSETAAQLEAAHDPAKTYMTAEELRAMPLPPQSAARRFIEQAAKRLDGSAARQSAHGKEAGLASPTPLAALSQAAALLAQAPVKDEPYVRPTTPNWQYPATHVAVPLANGGVLTLIDKKLVARHADGSERWSFALDKGVAQLAATPDGGAIVIDQTTKEAELIRLSATGTVTLRQAIEGGRWYAKPIILEDGSALLSAEKTLARIDERGEDVWRIELPTMSLKQALFDEDGALYVRTYWTDRDDDDGHVVKLDPATGAQAWAFETWNDAQMYLDSDGALVAGEDRLNRSNGEVREKKHVDVALPMRWPNGGFVGRSEKFVTFCDDSGEETMRLNLRGKVTALALAPDGTVYAGFEVGEHQCRIVQIAEDGRKLWTSEALGSAEAPAVVHAFAFAKDGALFATLSDEDGFWAQPEHVICFA